jgi:Fe-Mn family superoxide dismutase
LIAKKKKTTEMKTLFKVPRVMAKRGAVPSTSALNGWSVEFRDPMHGSSFSSASQSYKLPDLPFDYHELEPSVNKEIMEIHHKKHHQTYVNNLNAALEKYNSATSANDIGSMIALQSAIKFNGGGHLNHSIFWTNLAPSKHGGGAPPSGEVGQRLNQQFGSLDKFIEKFNTTTAAVQGSGWGWLGYDAAEDRLKIATCPNQDPLSTLGLVPLLGIDVWEHAYYLQYKNARPDYLKAIWKVVNWKNVEDRLQQAKKK